MFDLYKCAIVLILQSKHVISNAIRPRIEKSKISRYQSKIL